MKRIWLSPPEIAGQELKLIEQALDSNWISTTGPQVRDFERNFGHLTGQKFCLATNSGTSALHLALLSLGVKEGDLVICPSFTFAATAFPILYCGAHPVFVDSDPNTWNIDPELLEKALKSLSRKGKKPKAVIVVHIYGNPVEIKLITEICLKYEVEIIEDSAESLGATYQEKPTGTFGTAGVFSFNGNKIITTSGGGMLITNSESIYKRASVLANQASIKKNYYHHEETGYNYRLSNILAALGIAQLKVLEARVISKRRIFETYFNFLKGFGIEFQKEVKDGVSNRWLSCILLKNEVQRNKIVERLEKLNIESRFLMKPLHTQAAFRGAMFFSGNVSEHLYSRGVCLPSGISITAEDQTLISEEVKFVYQE